MGNFCICGLVIALDDLAILPQGVDGFRVHAAQHHPELIRFGQVAERDILPRLR